jgi:hypothetical protein
LPTNFIIEADVFISSGTRGIRNIGFRHDTSNANGYMYRLQTSGGDGGFFILNGAGSWSKLGSNDPDYSANTWHNLKLLVRGSNFTAWVDNVYRNSVIDSTYSNTKIGTQDDGGADLDSYVDNYIVRGYIYPGPSSSLGSEETAAKTGLVSTIVGMIPFYTNISNPYTTTYLSRGQNQIVTFYVNATGGGTNVFFAFANMTSNLSISNITSSWTVTIDTTPPKLTIINPLNQSYGSSSLDFNISGDEQLDSCKFTLNNWQNNYTMNKFNETYFYYKNSSMIDNVYTVKFSCMDLAQNINDSMNVNFTIDAYGPNVNLTTPLNATYSNNTQKNLSFSAFDSVGLKNATLYIFNSSGSLINLTNMNISGKTIVTGIVYIFAYDGIFNWFYKIFDIAGHESSTQNNTITIDTLNPLINYGAGTQNDFANVSQNWIYINITLNETNFANLTFYLYNGSAGYFLFNQTTYNDSRREINWTNLGDGLYWYNTTIFDLALNRNITQTRQIRLDTSAPDIRTVFPNNFTYGYNITFLNYTVADPLISKCWYNINDTSNISIGCGQNISTHLGDGTYTWKMYANDTLGHIRVASVSFKVDTGVPAVIIYFPQNTTYSYNVTTMNFTASDATLDKCWYVLNGGANVSTSCSSNVTNLLSQEGPNSLWIYANDSDSNVGLDFVFFTMDTTAPNVTIISPKNDSYYPENILFNVSGSESLDFCKFTIDNWTTNYTMNRYNSTDFNYILNSVSVGSYVAKFWCNDTVGNVNNTANVSFSALYPNIKLDLIYPAQPISVPKSSYFNFTVNVSCGLTDCGVINVTLDPSDNWWNGSWNYRKTINITNVGSTVLSNFTTYLNLSKESYMQSDFDDIRFLNGSCGSSTILPLNYEIENYTSSMADVWIKIPSFTPGVNQICMYYGNPSAINGQNKTGVWDNNYKMVLHISEPGTGTRYDSTVNGNDGTPVSYVGNEKAVPGVIDGADNLSSGKYINSNYLQNGVTNYTISVWVKTNDAGTMKTFVQDRGSGAGQSLTLGIGTTGGGHGGAGLVGFELDSNSIDIGVSSTQAINDNNWHNVVGVWSAPSGTAVIASQFKIYIDGVNAAVTTGSTGSANSPLTGLGGTKIGSHDAWATFFNGAIDEVTISTESKSSDWINMSYQMVANQNKYVKFGLVENKVKGIVSTNIGDIPFFTDVNPKTTSSLKKGESQVITFVVNTTGNPATYEFFAFANLVKNSSVTNSSSTVNVTILSSLVSLIYPGYGDNFSNFTIPFFNFSINEGTFSNCKLFGSWGTWGIKQTINNPQVNVTLNFSSESVGNDGYYFWNVNCTDLSGNSITSPTNFTFSSFLPVDSLNSSTFITYETRTDGKGNVFLSWASSNHTAKYRIYYTENASNPFVLLNETSSLNFTDTNANHSRRRFYEISSWNPISEVIDSDIIGKTIYYLQRKPNVNTINWMGFYIQNNLTTANKSLNQISNITSFTMWNSTIQKKVTCNNFSCPSFPSCTETNCNFDLVDGQGYEVSLNSSSPIFTNWSIVGLVKEKVNVSLAFNSSSGVSAFGRHWISMYYNSSLKDAKNLMGNISFSDTMTNWDELRQTSQGYISWIPNTNFALEPEKGYEISVTQNSNYNQS